MEEKRIALHRNGESGGGVGLSALVFLCLGLVAHAWACPLRLTGRGLNASLENFSVAVTPDGTAIIMR